MKLAWSNLARSELADIRRYSVDTWGRSVAVRYLQDLRNAARTVAANPTRARLLAGPWRIMRARSHYLVRHCDDGTDTLTVARVLHTAMDIERHLPPGEHLADGR